MPAKKQAKKQTNAQAKEIKEVKKGTGTMLGADMSASKSANMSTKPPRQVFKSANNSTNKNVKKSTKNSTDCRTKKTANKSSAHITTTTIFEPLLNWGISERFESFLRLDEAKRDRIVGALLNEFSAKAYEIASTNNIVKEAAISKGLLFHYFGDKAGAYCFLIEHTMRAFVADYQGSFPVIEGDVFDMLLSATYGKLQTTLLLRQETALFIRFMTDTLPDQLAVMRDKYFILSRTTMDLVTHSLDEARLRKGIDKKQAANIINWVCEGLTQEVLATIKPEENPQFLEELVERVDTYIMLLRKMIYR